MTKLKILHTADFHLGVGVRGAGFNSLVIQKRDRDFIEQLWRIRKLAVENECDFLIIAGDVFHSLRPSGLLLNEFSRFIASLAEKDIYTIVVAGNHDQPRTTRTEAYIKALHEARAPNFYYIKKPCKLVLKGSRSGRKVGFICLPYLPPTAGERAAYVNAIDATLSRLVSSIGECDYIVTVAHFYVEGAKIGPSESYGPYIPLYDIAIPKHVFINNRVSYTALGHIHYHQEVSSSVIYSGSIERINFGEEDEEKGVVLVEEAGGDLSSAFIKLPCRPLITLPREKYGYAEEFFDLTGALNPTRKLIELLSRVKIPDGAILRLRVKLPYGRGIDRSEVSKYMKSINVLHWFIEPQRVRVKCIVSSGSFRDVREAFREYVEKVFVKRRVLSLSKDVVELIISEGLRIIDEVERGE